MKVYPVSIHGRKRWRLDITVGGVRKQAVFKTRQQAESEAAAVREVADSGAQSLVAPVSYTHLTLPTSDLV